MASRAGVGHSVKANSMHAGVEAADRARSELGGQSPGVALLFHTSKHDPRQFHAGVRSVLGPDVRLVGGYAGGVITRDYLGYEGYESAVALLASDSLRFDVFAEAGLRQRGERMVGEALGRQIPLNGEGEGAGIVYMYDSVKSFTPDGGFDMNIGTYVMEGLTDGLPRWPPAVGMGMLGSMHFSPTYQFFDGEVLQQAALALLVRGPSFRMRTTIMHGCRPSSSYHTVTRADENVVLEIDGRPALDVIDELLGPDSDRGWTDYPLFVTLGVNKGDKFGPFREADYANRLCAAIDHERRGLVMFEPDLVEGSEVQLMRRAFDFEYIHRRAEELLQEIGDREPFFALYLDCMGRASAYCGSEGEEGSEVQQVIGARMPLLGLYTGVELAELGGRQQALDWTGVLCVFCE